MKRHALLAALAAAVATPASADTSVATLSGLNIAVIDLTPDDGVAASLTFLSVGGTVSAGIATVPGAGIDSIATDIFRSGNVVAHNAAGGTAAVAALFEGQVQAMGTVGRYGEFGSQSWMYGNFVLGANTQLVLTGRTSLGTGFAGGTRNDVGSAAVSIDIVDGQDGGGSGQHVSYAQEITSYTAGPVGLNEQFTLTFTNDGAAALAGRVELSATATGYVSPVPEPSGWLMLASGLVLTGALARRRASRANGTR